MESAARKMADFGDETAQNVRDSVRALSNADGASADAFNGIRGNTGDLPEGNSGDGTSVGGGTGGSSQITKMLSGGGTEPEASAETETGGGEKSSTPEWLLKQWEEGEKFNKDNHWRYEYNEVRLKSGKRVDSYDEDSEIVERKNTQLSEVEEGTAKSYIDSLRYKYKAGEQIGDTPKNRRDGIAGKILNGDHILEVPPQDNPVPKNVLDHAAKHNVTIRDINGNIYS